MGGPRRISPRLQEIPEDKRPYYGSDRKRTHVKEGDTVSPSKAQSNSPRKGCFEKPPRKKSRAEDKCNESNRNSGGKKEILGANHDKWPLTGIPLIDENGISFIARVKETLRTFNMYYLHFVKEEKQRCKKPEEPEACDAVMKRPSKRPDLKAIKKMKKDKKFLYPKRIIGPVPGIKVGFQFFARTEMVAVGLHGHWLSGIDYIGESKGKKDKNIDTDYSFPLAVAIVLSGQYEDDVDNSEEIVYTGQGGHDLLGNKRQIKDQVMSHGNLALKNSMKHSVPIRVIRGHKSDTSYTRKIYTYDGLYKVVDNWAEKGVAGFTVFKYRLKRLPGQPELVTNEVRFVRGKGPGAHSEIPGLVCKDISNGQEIIPIPVTNIVDLPVTPEGFIYMNSIEIASNVKIPRAAPGCKCKGTCTDRETCSCVKRNRSDFPYVHLDGGRLIEPMDVVFECGPNCGCGPDCVNRTSQHGLKHRLEVYRTPDKGWAVRSWDYIPSGAPVCEYIGVLRKSDELENVTENDYIFEIDCWQTINEIGGRERRLGDVALPYDHAVKRTGKLSESVPEFCLDAGSKGNVARFINHSCDPNLFVQCILSSHHDIALARIVLFAADNIVPLQELTYDYGFELNSVVGSDGKIKKLACCCGAACCRKRLY